MKIWHCQRCNRNWSSRGDTKPLRCGKCKSPYWDRARRIKAEIDHVPWIKKQVAPYEVPAWAKGLAPRALKSFADKYERMPLNETEWETYVKRGC